MLGWAEARCRESLPRVPDGIRMTMVANTISSDAERHGQLERACFKLIRHFFDMKIKLDTRPPTPQWPEGVTLFHYQTMEEVLANLEMIMKAVNESFRDHFGFVERSMEQVIELWTHRIATDTEFDPTLWFLAMDGDEVAGTSLCRRCSWEDPEEAYVAILAVRRSWRRHGLGLALLHHSFGEFYRRGKPRAGLGVDAGSLTGAVGLYERAGMHVTRQYDAYEKELRAGEDIRVQ
ncbi:MAG: GNAT family N-acetyltransferase [Chloroflexi bacterium]|nr:GNAT family N-acetyltransferase [Chloroflexota bacterium]